MSASKIDLTPGSTRPASTGRKAIQVDASGNLVLVDELGTVTMIGGSSGVSDHPSLTDRNLPNQHSISSISNLNTALSDKEDRLGNPLANGMHLVSSMAGVRSWETPEKPHIFSARNEIWQSFSSQSEIVTEWNVETLKHSKYGHSTATNPEAITINHTGFIQVWLKMNFEINESNRILFRSNISLDLSWLPETLAYAYARHQSYIDVATIGVNGVILPVTSGQILRVHNQIAYNDDISGVGDQENVNTIWGESAITIATVVEP